MYERDGYRRSTVYWRLRFSLINKSRSNSIVGAIMGIRSICSFFFSFHLRFALVPSLFFPSPFHYFRDTPGKTLRTSSLVYSDETTYAFEFGF